ncbi:AAA family ATPase [Geobacter argillaceus]|uniref:Putative AbiEii toxin of type IV toxin-antitoxin system n=1 Tax=Geobacter argillaceus TaxID=345631 RepID=A0A562V5D7_9BACT|nr:ATP-binding protein [Geobacter argillaceus]TWJ13124.1 putative AbiEii toxin of type IV toxin-antitoxin system [Geobacter argillaceus]
MRVKSIYISEYKNLREFTLPFDGTSFIDVFVGKNGTGKSNLFEALVEIFRHIVEYDRDKMPCNFNYGISFEIEGKTTQISWNSGTLAIDGKERKNIGKTPLPDNVLIYYSGHNDTVAGLVEQYEDAFRKRIKRADFDEARYFIGIGPDYKELLLAVLLMQPETCKARQFICQKLGIETVIPEVRLVLERPAYAADSRFDIEFNDETDRYWRPEGITKTFLNRLHRCINIATGGPVRPEGYFASDGRYILYFDIAKIRQEFNDLSSQELFRQLDNLKTLGMLAKITIPLKLTSGVDATIAHFSDGQFQSVYIYSIVELFKDRNCITLLDEPDAFLHPEWQFDFLKQVFEITDTTANNHVLMSSHSAVTLIPHDKRKIKFFDIKDNRANCYDLPKSIAINKLSSALIRYSEQEQLLSIINAIQIENKPVLFTEGSTDPIIIKEAWYKLYDEDMPFIPFYAFSCTYIKQLLTDNRIHGEMGGLPIFALFDFDKAYDQWNGLNGDVIENDPYKGKIKKWAEGDSYAIMLPVPPNPHIQRQVIKNAITKETYGGNSCCEIEHIFYGQAATATYFQVEPCPGGTQIVFKADSDKTSFAKEVIHLLDASCFETFRPMFEFITSKCAA